MEPGDFLELRTDYGFFDGEVIDNYLFVDEMTTHIGFMYVFSTL